MRKPEPESFEQRLARLAEATSALEPPSGFEAALMARLERRPAAPRFAVLLGQQGARSLPWAALAVAAAMALAWFGERRVELLATEAIAAVAEVP